MTCDLSLFIWGYTGTGKTLFLTEALKIKLNKLRTKRKKGQTVNIIVTVFKPEIEDRDQDCSLMKDLKEKYLKNLGNENFSRSGDEKFIRFINFKQLCREFIGDDCASEQDRLGNTKFWGKI